MTVLVTGATGFSGRALLQFLDTLGRNDIAGIARTVPSEGKVDNQARLIACDITDRLRVTEVMQEIRPDYCIHLAGLTRGEPFDLFRANITGTENLLDAVVTACPACRVLVISSSAVYGYAGNDPIGEDTPVKSLGDYGASKAAQEKVALDRYEKRGMQVAIARPFNLVGPGQPDSFLCGRIVRQVIEIERGERENLELLETRSYRDFIDVRDAVRAYSAIVLHQDFERACASKIFNVASGAATPVSRVIELAEEITGRTFVVELPEDPPVVAIPFQLGDISQIKRVIGWKPEISLKKTLEDMIEEERGRRTGKNF